MPQIRIPSYLATVEDIDRDWFHISADGQILGRLAAKIATVLMGKHKPTYTPHVDMGDFVVVTDAEKIRVTGSKAETMKYCSYSYYPGGYKEVSYRTVMEEHPERILIESVRRMLPKNAIARHMLRKLKVYTGPTHPHSAQCPQELKL